MRANRMYAGVIYSLFFLLLLAGCTTINDGSTTDSPEDVAALRAIQNKGSDTLVNLALAWAERYREVDPAQELNPGQQQRLCIARTIAVSPEVILMDEPCSALDPVATLSVEDLMRRLAKEYTIVIVTHNMQQAARVSDYTGFFWLGEIVEFNETTELFITPKEELTEAYITGRRG